MPEKVGTYEKLEQIKQDKLDTYYGVKSGIGTACKVEDVDTSKRTVKVITNTFYHFDDQADVLIEGCTTKTIKENGPDSKDGPKIKNVKDHKLDIRIGLPKVIDERKIDGNYVQYAESEMLKTTAGNDMLIEYQSGVIDQHSIGLHYLDLEILTADAKNWKPWIDRLINPKDAEEYGYMFLVKEIRQIEFSPVSFGANKLTPYLGCKSNNPELVVMKVMEKLDRLNNMAKSGKKENFNYYNFYLEHLQLKQVIKELFIEEPSLKDTLLNSLKLGQGRQNEQQDTFDLDKALEQTKFI